jgi:hypothetical protein
MSDQPSQSPPTDTLGKWRGRGRIIYCTDTELIIQTEESVFDTAATNRIPYGDIRDISSRSIVWSPTVQYGLLMTAVALAFIVAIPLLDADGTRTIASTLVSFPIIPLLGTGGVSLAAVGVGYDRVYELSGLDSNGNPNSYQFRASTVSDVDSLVETARANCLTQQEE